jgi:ferrous iron transport protein A
LTAAGRLDKLKSNFVFKYNQMPDPSMSRAHAPSSPSRGAVSLASLQPGACGLVDSVDTSSPVGRRLADLGFLPATPVRVLRRAPLGDPTVYELRGYRLCMRRDEAARVRVVPTDPRSPAAP